MSCKKERALKYRGYVLVLCSAVLAGLWLQPAFLEVMLILFIISASKDGKWIMGDMAERVNRLPGLTSPFAKALLMSVPVKTLTALLGTSDPQTLQQIAFSATVALVGLALALGLLATWFGASKRSGKSPARRTARVVPVLDLALVLLLLLLGDDGPALFGALGQYVHESVPALREPWVRGALAILPIKTVATLTFAEAQERQSICAHGYVTTGILATMTFVACWTSSFAPVLIALGAGIIAACASFLSLNTFKLVVRKEAEA